MTEPAVASWRDLLSPVYAIRVALVLLGIWLNAADGLVTVTLMPSVARDLGGTAYYGWAVAFFLTASILAGASAGQLSQRMGLRSASVLAGLVYSAGCFGSAASGGVAEFLIGRTLQGAGAGWIVGFCYVAIEATFPERLWARLFAAAAGAWGIASVFWVHWSAVSSPRDQRGGAHSGCSGRRESSSPWQAVCCLRAGQPPRRSRRRWRGELWRSSPFRWLSSLPPI